MCFFVVWQRSVLSAAGHLFGCGRCQSRFGFFDAGGAAAVCGPYFVERCGQSGALRVGFASQYRAAVPLDHSLYCGLSIQLSVATSRCRSPGSCEASNLGCSTVSMISCAVRRSRCWFVVCMACFSVMRC